MSDEIIAGIDVSEQTLDVHLPSTGETFAVARDDAGIADLAERLRAAGGLEGMVVASNASPSSVPSSGPRPHGTPKPLDPRHSR